MEELGLTVGFILTLMVYSYLIRDNLLYRIAVYVFVGIAAGFVTIVTVDSVLIPWFNLTLESNNIEGAGLGLIPVMITLLLLFKASPRLGCLSNLGMAFMIGIGAAVALVGALTGTLLPISFETMNEGSGDKWQAIIIFVGVASSLVYFQYMAHRTPAGEIERNRAVRWMSLVGEGFLMVTLGALYAAAILTSLIIFSDRMSFVLSQVLG
jgi:hypothetical protein